MIHLDPRKNLPSRRIIGRSRGNLRAFAPVLPGRARSIPPNPLGLQWHSQMTEGQGMDLERLVLQAQSGDARAFDRLLRLHEKELFRHVLRMTLYPAESP